MSQPSTLPWFAAHELRLSWRDWLSMMTAGRRGREKRLAFILIIAVAGLHALAFGVVGPLLAKGVAADKPTLLLLTGSALLAFSLMLSQAVESVTRVFYARADLDLVLSSPAPAKRLFAVRILAVAVATTSMSLLLAAPFINVAVLLGGFRWLGAYGVLLSFGALATAAAVVVSIVLFRLIGPKRTRFVAQVVAAIMGAGFVIGIQIAAIVFYGSISRFEVFQSEALLAAAPGPASALWWPARAAMGEGLPFLVVLGFGLGILGAVIAATAGTFGQHVLAAAGVSMVPASRASRGGGFRSRSKASALRAKEWALLKRDPWLLSQSLMQVLYLLPPAVLLWHQYGEEVSALVVAVPVLVTTVGQLGGGLAWLAVSGEDAPDLVATAPITRGAALRAKIEAVLACVLVVAGPLLLGILWIDPRVGLVAIAGVLASACSAIAVQLWFRSQVQRSRFRRRHISSRVATFAEAFSSLLWAGASGLAAAGSWFAVAFAILAFLVLAVAWSLSPKGQTPALAGV
ncbi:MAG: permease [Parvibaculaceae bacterium]